VVAVKPLHLVVKVCIARKDPKKARKRAVARGCPPAGGRGHDGRGDAWSRCQDPPWLFRERPAIFHAFRGDAPGAPARCRTAHGPTGGFPPISCQAVRQFLMGGKGSATLVCGRRSPALHRSLRPVFKMSWPSEMAPWLSYHGKVCAPHRKIVIDH